MIRSLCERALALLVLALGLAGCASTPPTAVHQPMTVRPQVQLSNPGNGAIYQANFNRPLFEDRKARYPGDTLTINIVENTQAKTNSDSTASRTSAMNSSITALAGLPLKGLQGLTSSGSGSSSFEGKGGVTGSNVFTGVITCTVIEVLGNGNLLVSGEKQIAIGQGKEYIRFSGVVNPTTVTTANTVNSSQVADARIEYQSSGYINDSQVMGWLQRFFLSFLPI